MSESDLTATLIEQVRAAASAGGALAPVGGGTKGFLGRLTQLSELDLSAHRGIVSYEPTELVITARSGTPLTEIESVLAEHHQELAFEPPRFGPESTLGGAIAGGLSGPRRPFAGAARDFVLGTKVLNGKAEVMRFGGQVMKNVAGYDVSRLMTGAMGTLGVLLEVSLKVLPRHPTNETRCFELGPKEAIEKMNAWAGQPLPLSAIFYNGEILHLRLSGSERAVKGPLHTLGGAPGDNGIWPALRDHGLPFFRSTLPLWRIAVAPATPPLQLPGEQIIDWGGAQRWLRSDADPATIREVAHTIGGHAMLFRHGDRRGEVYHPLAPGLLRLHQRLKSAFDPHRVFNPGRMYSEL